MKKKKQHSTPGKREDSRDKYFETGCFLAKKQENILEGTNLRIANQPYNYTSFYIVLPDGVETPETLSQQLGLVPTRIQTPPVNTLPPASWILRIQDLPSPNDCQEHLDWLLAKLKGKEDFIRDLRNKGYWVGVICHWYSECGKPTLTPETVKHLEDLEMCLDFELERWE